jgi:large repetitive protein
MQHRQPQYAGEQGLARTLLTAFLSALFFLLAALPADGQVPEALERAQSWLAGAQHPDGSFGTVPELAPRDTALAVLALAEDPDAAVNVESAALYLEGVAEANTHFRSRRLVALAAAGRDVIGLLPSLFEFENGGGMGAFGHHQSTHLDTALAIEALALDEGSYRFEIAGLVDFARLHRNPDGGWGVAPEAPSAPYYSAEMLRALTRLERLAVGEGVLDGAVAFLLAGQPEDGSFGSVLETAVITRALLLAGVSPAELLHGSPVPFLLARQGADGSWESDPFTTAQVILALRLQRPNLRVAEAVLAGGARTAPAGLPLGIVAKVTNVGAEAAGTSLLEIRRQDDGAVLTAATVPALAAGESAEIPLEVPTDDLAGTVALVAVADAAEAVDELDEDDNETLFEVTLRTGADLALLVGDLSISPPRPEPGEVFTLNASARNLGETAVSSFAYRVTRRVAGATTEVLETGTAGSLEPGGGLLIPVAASLPEGEHTLEVTLDPDGLVEEENEANNSLSWTFFVVDGDLPDLAVSGSDVVLAGEPLPGEAVAVTVTVGNPGGREATADLVLYENDPEGGGVELRWVPVSVAAGGVATVSGTITLSADAWGVTAVVDPDDAVVEADETNNRAVKAFRELPDLAVGFDNVEILTPEPLAGDPVEMLLTVRNGGTAPVSGATVAVYSDEGGAADGLEVFRATLPLLAPGANAGVPFTWPAVAGVEVLEVVVDPDDAVTELSETNNRTRREVAVPRPAGPNLKISALDLAGLGESAETLALNGAVGVEIANDGDEEIVSAHEVRLFEDWDGDGRQGAGEPTLGSVVAPAGLAAGGSTAVSVPVTASLAFRRSAVWVEVDAGRVVAERREDDNRALLFAECVEPPAASAGFIAPVEEWFLPGVEIETTPVVVQLSDDNGDGRVDSRDVPDVVFHTEDAQGGALMAVSGLDGTPVWTVRSTPGNPLVGRFGQVAAADLDGDGVVEVLGHRRDGRLVAFGRGGAVLWVSDPVPGVGQRHAGGPAVGDLDGDGVPEIVLGRSVLSNRGELLAHGTANQGQNYNVYGPFGVALPPGFNSLLQSVVADVDLDGRNELVAGDTVYRLVLRPDGSHVLEMVWDGEVDDRLMADGFSAVGNLDDDPEAEIVYVSSGKIRVYHHDGAIHADWRVMVPVSPFRIPTFWGSAPTLADLDGDGRTEILVLTATHLIAYDGRLAVRWSRELTEDFGGIHGVTAFDFDGDGVREVLFLGDTVNRDARLLFVLDGATGQTLHSRKMISKTGLEYPVVADVDGDGRAEMVVPSNFGFNGDGSTQGLHVLGHPSYRGTRPIWNQVGYHVTNVLLDGTVPSPQVPPWSVGDGFRVNRELPAQAHRFANLTVGLPRVGAAGPAGVPVTVRVGNGGLEAVPAGVVVELFETATLDADPDAPAVGIAVTPRALLPGRWQDVEVVWAAAGPAGAPASAVVDRPDQVAECAGVGADDNRVDFVLTETVLPDLSVVAGGVTAPSPSTAGQPVPVAVTVANLGAAASAETVVRLWDGEPGVGTILGDLALPALAPGAVASVVFPWDTLGEAGVHLVYAVVDPDGVVTEADLANNRGLTTVELLAPALPDPAVEAVTVAPTTVAAGRPVLATVTVINRGAPLVDGFLLALTVNGLEVERRILPLPLASGETVVAELPVATDSLAGVARVVALVDPDNALAEVDEANNRAETTLTLSGAPLSARVDTDALAYEPGSPVTATVTIVGAAPAPVEATLAVRVVDALGQPVAEIFSGVVTAAADEPSSTIHVWPSGTAPEGAYSVLAEVSDSAGPVVSGGATVYLESRVEVSATLFTDRDDYAPSRPVVLTGSVTNRSVNATLESVAAELTVTAPGGETVFTSIRPLESFFPGARVPVDAVWNPDAAAAGAYQATLTLRDADALPLASAVTVFAVAASDRTGDGLAGELEVSPDPVGVGAPVELAYELRNGGNADMTELVLRLDVLRLEDGVRVARREVATPLLQSAARRGAVGLDTTDLPAGDLLATLVGVLPGREVRLDRAAFSAVAAVSVADATVREGNAGTVVVEVPVTLSQPAVDEVSVSWTTRDGTAVAGEDFTAASGVVTFAPGDTRRTVAVTVLGDAAAEPEEVLLVTLADPVGTVLGDPQGLVTITDEEGCAGPELLIDPEAEAGAEAGWSTDGTPWRRRFAAPPPLEGLASFAAPGDGVATLEQTVDLSPFAALADGPGQALHVEAFLWTAPAEPGAEDAVRLVVEILDGDGAVLDTHDSGPVSSTGTWAPVTVEPVAGVGVRALRLRLEATDNGGDGLAAFVDRVSVRTLGTPTLALADARVLEGDPPAATTATVIATLSCPLPSSVSVALSGAATDTLTLAPGEVTAEIPVPVTPDLLDEPDEILTVEISAPVVEPPFEPPFGLVLLIPSVRVTVVDDDAPVRLSALSGNAAEGDGVARVDVTLSSPSGREVTVAYETVAGFAADAASADDDFRIVSGTLTFAPGETVRTVEVPLADDEIHERIESFTLRLSNPTAATLAEPGARVTVFDDDPLEVSVDDVHLLEGDGPGVVVFTVRLSRPSAVDASVAFATATATATAVAGEDFGAVSGILSFPASSGDPASAVVEVPILGDTVRETSESFRLVLTSPVEVTLPDPEAVATLIDDDGILISVGDVTVREGDPDAAPAAVFPVTLQKASTVPVEVAYRTADGTAGAGVDYEPSEGVALFVPGALRVDVTVPLVPDLTEEDVEVFFLELTAPVEGEILDGRAAATVVDDDGWVLTESADDLTIPGCLVLTPRRNTGGAAWRKSPLDLSTSFDVTWRVFLGADHDAYPGITYAFQQQGFLPPSTGTSYLGFDGISPSVALEVDTDPGPSDDPSYDHLAVRLNGSRSHNGYPARPATADFANIEDGEEHLLRVVWNAESKALDVHFDGDERLVMERDVVGDLFGDDPAVIQGFTSRVSNTTTFNLHYVCPTARCVDPGTDPEISIGDARVEEGDTGQVEMVFPVTLACPADHPVEVAYASVDGSAEAGTDYLATAGALTFEPGQTALHVRVPVLGDTEAEPAETFEVVLGNVVGGALRHPRATGTILSDEILLTLTPEFVEGTGGADFRNPLIFRLGGPAVRPVPISYSVTGGTATAHQDFTPRSGSFTLGEGQEEGEIVVLVRPDDLVEGDETILVTVTSSELVPSQQTFTVTLRDDDCAGHELLANGGNEEPLVDGEIQGWTEVLSDGWILGDNNSGWLSAREGRYNFYTTEGFVDVAELRQDVDVSSYAAEIDAGSREFAFSGHMASRQFGSNRSVDRARIVVEYRDAAGRVLDRLDSNALNRTYWRHIAEARLLPVGTRTVRVRLIATREESHSVDGYFDSIHFRPLGYARLSIGDTQVTEGAVGTTDALLPVTLACADGSAEVRYVTASGSAAAGVDFTPVTGVVRFAAGETEKIVAVPVIGDLLVEGDETFAVELVAPVGAIVDRGRGEVVIVDDESVLSVANVSVVEGNQGTTDALFTVAVAPPLPLKLTVDYATVPGTATPGADYEPVTGTLVIPAGAASATIPVPVVGDGELEGNETFELTLSSLDNAVLGDAVAGATILDDDNVLTVADALVTEGNAGTRQVRFELELTPAPLAEVRVDWATVAGTATEGEDFEPASGTAVFAPGQVRKTVDVLVIGDEIVEPSETFYLALSNPVGTRVLQQDPRGVIVDDDDCPSPDLLTNGGAEAVLVGGKIPSWTLVQGGLRRTDNGPFEGHLAFEAYSGNRMEAYQDVDVSVFADAVDQGRQRFAVEGQVRSGNESGSLDEGSLGLEFLAPDEAVLGSLDLGSAVGTGWAQLSSMGPAPPGTRALRLRLTARGIPGDTANAYFDALRVRALGTPMITVGDVVVREDDGRAPFPVRLSCPHDEPVAVALATTDGSALAGLDYEATEATITFPVGSTERFFEVPVLDDSLDEPAETFAVLVTGAPLPVSIDRAQGSVVDEERAPALAKTGSIVTEGSGEALRFTLELEAPSAFTVQADYATVDGSARAGEDYLPVAGTVVFEPGRTRVEIDVPLVDDRVAEPHETVLLELSALLGVGTVERRTDGLILDDDGLAGGECPGPELVVNGGGEVADASGGPAGWISTGAPWTRTPSPAPVEGSVVLAPPAEADAELYRDVDLSPFAAAIDGGGLDFDLRAWLRGVSGGTDPGRLVAEWRDGDGAVLAVHDGSEVVPGDGWTALKDRRPAPVGSRSLRVRLVARRAGASGAPQVFFDGVSLRTLGLQVVSVADAVVPEGDRGSREHLLVARLACADPAPVTVGYGTSGGTATAGADYLPITGTFTFDPGELVRLVPVRVVGDRLFDPGESFGVVLEGVTGAVAAGPATVTILDDDPDVSPVEITPAADLALAEGETASHAFEVVVPPGATAPKVDVYFVADNTSSMSVWLNIAKQRSRDLMGALQTELPGVSWQFGAGRYGDYPSHDPWYFHQQDLTADTVAVEAAINGWSTLGFGLDIAEGSFFALDHIASDADPAGGDIGWRSDAERILVWFGDAAGNEPVCQALTGFDYDITEELLIGKLRAVGIRPIAVSTPSGLDNDPVATGGGYASVCPIGGRPGQATRIAAATGGVHVLAPSTGQLIETVLDAVRRQVEEIGELGLRATGDAALFVDGITPETVGPLANDVEHRLPFVADLTGVVPCTDIIQVFEGAVEVLLDRAPAAEVPLTVRVPSCGGTSRGELSVADATVTEGAAGETVGAEFVVTLAAPIGREVRVDVATEPVEAEPGVDFEPVATTLVFAPGEVRRTVSVTVYGDLDPEDDETFRLVLEKPVGAVLIDAEAVGVILDDDGFPQLTAGKTDALAVDADADGVPSPGDTLRYTLTVESTGTAPVSGVVLRDLSPQHATAVPGSAVTDLGVLVSEDPLEVDLGLLEPGARAAVAFDVVLDDVFPAGVTEVANQGTVESDALPTVLTDDPDPAGAADPTVTSVTAAPRLVAEKTAASAAGGDLDGDGALSPGDRIAYTVVLRNLGNAPATGVVLTDPGAEHTALVAGSATTSAGTATGEDPLVVEVAELPVGETVTVTFEALLDDPFPAGVTAVSNQGTVTADGVAAALTDDPAVGGEADPTVTAVTAAPVLTVEKTDTLFADPGSDGEASPGDEILYTVRVANDGNTAATGVTVSDALPAHAILVPGSPRTSHGAVLSTTPLTVAVGQVAAGDVVTVTYRVVLDDPFPVNATAVTNQATVTSAELDPVPSDDPDTPEPGDATVTPVFVAPSVVVTGTTVTEGNPPETAEAVFTVTLSRPAGRPVRVAFETVDGFGAARATADADYGATAGELELAAGAVSGTVAVAVLGDLLDEPDETFTLRLTAVEHAVILDPADGEAEAVIVDDDEAAVSIGDVTVSEGDDGVTLALFPVTLAARADREIRVDYGTSSDGAGTGVATEGVDYRPTGGTLVFPPLAQAATVTVEVLGDTFLEAAEETFRVELTAPAGTLLADAVGIGTIVDDEVCAGPNLLANPGAEERTADGSIRGWRLVEGDWLRDFGPPEPLEGRVQFGAGEAEHSELVQDVDVSVFADAVDAGEQSFVFRGFVRTFEETPPDVVRVVVEYHDDAVVLDAWDSGEISSPLGWLEISDERSVAPGTRRIRVRLLASRFTPGILDGFADALELRPLRSPALTVGDVTVAEADGAAVFPVRFACAVEEPVAVAFATVDGAPDGAGSATAGEDYVAGAGTLTLDPGETEAEVPVPVLPDEIAEGAETFLLLVEPPSGIVAVDPVGRGTIFDDDFCARSHGFWKTHRDRWPVEWLEIGGVEVEADEMMAYLNAKGGDATLHLVLQLVATRLNLAAGSDPGIRPVVDEADAVLALHPPGSNPRGPDRQEVTRLKDLLDAYNNSCQAELRAEVGR